MHRGWLWLGLWIAIASVGVGQAVPRSVESIPRSTERITLYWLPPRGETPSAYRVFLDGMQVAEVGGAAKSYDFTGLVAGREYRLAVQAVYPDGRVSEIVERIDRTYRALPAEARYPILIVGGTASGVGAAITAARLGVKVALMEPTNRLGGMISNGVAVTDVRQRDRINGLYEEFRQRVEAYYRARGDDTNLYFYRNGLNFEPWVANMLIKQMVYAEPNIDLYFGVRPTRVFKKGNRITGVEFVTLDGTRRGRFTADIVIDATAEGDIAAWAGAPYRIGREPRSPEEPHAGVLYYDRLNDRFLPGSTGKGDRRIPGYAILMIVQNYPTPQVGDPPPGYNRLNYVLSPPWERSWAYLYGRIPPGNKFEVNQHPHGTTLQEVNYRYPTASWEERQRIYQIYKNHVLGYLHYIQTELGQPNLGLAEDEFRDSDHLPPILYVRKARRIEGEVFLKEMDIILARERVRRDAIAIGDYPMD
ncbi:MAG: FAD-dependent oxidoreductase, partial [Armatimonadota bacterium]|nr:FAD-dependent oxidoreductase [Armatimonadota bacterium]